MAVIRLTLLVTVLGGLTLLLVQNWSPVLPLVFLGMRSQPLPLALWILFSTAAGAGTSLLITSLFKLSNYFRGQPRQVTPKSTTTSNRSTANRKEEFTPPHLTKHHQIKLTTLLVMSLTIGKVTVQMMTGILKKSQGIHQLTILKLSHFQIPQLMSAHKNLKAALSQVLHIPTVTENQKTPQQVRANLFMMLITELLFLHISHQIKR